MENTQITETTQTTECDHCGNTFRLVKLKAHIEGEEKYFCCEGCETVYSLIRSISGERYYSLKGSQRIEPVDFDEGFENKYSQFDSDAIYEKFVRTNNGLSEVIIQITNIHCSACVWLNEKVLSETIGIRSAQINFASGRAKIVFNHTEIKLSEILKLGHKKFLLNHLDVEVEYGSDVIRQYFVSSVYLDAGMSMMFMLESKKTICLAPDKCVEGGCC